jgi:hypothetical protein
LFSLGINAAAHHSIATFRPSIIPKVSNRSLDITQGVLIALDMYLFLSPDNGMGIFVLLKDQIERRVWI